MGGRREGLTVGSEDCIFVAGDVEKRKKGGQARPYVVCIEGERTIIRIDGKQKRQRLDVSA